MRKILLRPLIKPQTFVFTICSQVSFSTFSKPFLSKYSQGDYYGVLQVSDPSTVSDQQLKLCYYTLLKKYHSDYSQGVPDEVRKEYEEITKCITRAYDYLQRERSKIKMKQGGVREEDKIAMKIFGKKFNDVKYDLYRQENWAKRHEFNEELRRDQEYKQSRENFSNNEGTKQNTTNQTFSEEPVEEDLNFTLQKNMKAKIPLGIIAVITSSIIIIGLLHNLLSRKKNQLPSESERVSEPPKYTKERFKQIQTKSQQMLQGKKDKVIQSVVSQRPKAILQFPTTKDPDLMVQLLEYSIAQDIHLYEVPPDYFFDNSLIYHRNRLSQLHTPKKGHRPVIDKKIKKFRGAKNALSEEFPDKDLQLETHYLNKIRLNTTLTLSLEAERCLQNIYVRVKDVINELQQTGKYVPPLVFFRFHGYIMMKLREKPLSLANYRGTEYVSLFDLFFDYYSPIFFKRDHYNEYLVGLDQISNFGHVHLNHRPIPRVYLKGTGKDKKKAVFMREQRIIGSEDKYVTVWGDYYKMYAHVIGNKSTQTYRR